MSIPYSITLLPLGPVDPVLLRRLRQALRKIFGLPVRLAPVALALPPSAWHPKRNQYHSTELLTYILANFAAPPGKILGVTMVDLYIPILTHVFGEAQLDGRVALISGCRPRGDLDHSSPSPLLVWSRMVKLGVHELGHTFGLPHCRDPRCVMGFATNLEKLDQKSTAFCSYCRVLLADAYQALGLRARIIQSAETPEPVYANRVAESDRKRRRPRHHRQAG